MVTILQNLLLLNYCSSKGCKQSALKKVVMMVPTVWGAYGCGVPVFINYLKILKLVDLLNLVDHEMFCLRQPNPVYHTAGWNTIFSHVYLLVSYISLKFKKYGSNAAIYNSFKPKTN